MVKECCFKDCKDTRHSTHSYCRYHAAVQFRKNLDFSTMSKSKYDNTNNCGICDKFVDGPDKNIDHDDDNGLVRGILCNKCNRGIGNFDDNAWRLAKAAEYLSNA